MSRPGLGVAGPVARFEIVVVPIEMRATVASTAQARLLPPPGSLGCGPRYQRGRCGQKPLGVQGVQLH